MTKFPMLAISDLSKDANSLDDLMSRFDMYGRYFSTAANDDSARLHIVTKKTSIQNGISASDFPHLQIVQSGKSFIAYQFSLFKYVLANRTHISIIIAGNPWKDFLHVLLIKLILGNPIQVSIHGEPYVKAQGRVSLKELLKNLWMRFFLRFADSVRVVSAHQIEPIISKYSVEKSKFFISPISVVMPSVKSGSSKEYLIAFVGRLHSERNLDSWLQIILGLYAKRQDFSIVIAGDGPEREQVSTFLRDKLPNLSVDILGRIPHREVQSLWSDVSVLLSTAENESFGLTLREAQLAGVQVVARRNSGTLANSDELDGAILLFDTTEEAILDLNQALTTPMNAQKISRVRELQEVINSNSLRALAQSWLA